MIQVSQVIQYLRSKMPDVNVGGAADYVIASDNSRLMVESQTTFVMSLFVMLGDFNAQTLSLDTLDEVYTEDICILACIDNRNDRTGTSAQSQVFLLRRALLSALLNYYGFDLDSHSLQYTHDSMVNMDRARYWHKFVFRLNGRLSPKDGWLLEGLHIFNTFTATYYSNDPLADEPIAEDIINNLYTDPID